MWMNIGPIPTQDVVGFDVLMCWRSPIQSLIFNIQCSNFIVIASYMAILGFTYESLGSILGSVTSCEAEFSSFNVSSRVGQLLSRLKHPMIKSGPCAYPCGEIIFFAFASENIGSEGDVWSSNVGDPPLHPLHPLPFPLLSDSFPFPARPGW